MIKLFKRWDFWFGIVGVLGVIFAVFAYFESHKAGRISYILETQKVFDPAALTGFSLVDADKRTIESSVYASEVIIWNSGDLSLSSALDRIREPLKINTNSPNVIYYFLVSKLNIVSDSNYDIKLSPD